MSVDPTTIPPTSPLPPRTNRPATLMTVGVGLVLSALLTGAAYLWSGFRPSPGTPATGSATAGTNGTTPSAPGTGGEEAAAEARRAKELADAKRRAEVEAEAVARRARVATLKAEGETVREALARFDEQAAAWKAGIASLRTDEAGRKLAADPNQLTPVATALTRDRVTPRQRAGWDEQFQQLMVPVVLADRDPTAVVVVAEDTLAQMTRLLTAVRAAEKELAADRAVVETAKTATSSRSPAAHTLAAALEQRTAAERTAELTQVEEARQAALKKQAEELAAIEAKKIEAEGATAKADALTKLQKAEHDKKLAEIAQKAEEEKQKAARARAQLLVEYEADLPTIKTTLPAFITHGKTHRKDTSNGPVSLTVIQSKRALEDSREGMKAFCHMAHQVKDRQSGPIPSFLGSEFDWQNLDKDTVRKAQGLIRKYGTIMVEKGLLGE
jgi:hypothetical protein